MSANLYMLRKMKGLVMRFNLHVIFQPFEKFFEKLVYSSKLSKWRKEKGQVSFNDFYNSNFEYTNRLKLFKHVLDSQGLKDMPLDYLEFGVAEGSSYMWWLNELKNPETRFFGFDTFTGLPEDWGHFKKGDMASPNGVPQTTDTRSTFYQGLFQQTLPQFLKDVKFSSRKKVIHMDADLYSSTLYVLTSIYPYLNKGDILFFDEFNVPLHEFKAFMEFTSSFYVEYEVLGAVNNYYQIAVILK